MSSSKEEFAISTLHPSEAVMSSSKEEFVFTYTGDRPGQEVRPKVTRVIVDDTVTSIGVLAFHECSSLTAIEIPSSVTSIGGWAFEGCSSLTAIEIPSSVTTIGDCAFDRCSSLTAIEIPSSVTIIGDDAFYQCSSLTAIEIPSSVTIIGDQAFRHCSSLSAIEIPSSVTRIGRSAFFGCSSLTAIEIPSSVTSIGDNAFQGCSSLTWMAIPSSVTSIGVAAFQGCSSLTSIVIPSSVKTIGIDVFRGCSSLEAAATKHGSKNVTDWLNVRFDDLPLHLVCYKANVTKEVILACCKDYPDKVKAVDHTNLTALHILMSNPRVELEMVEAFLDKYPEAATETDINGRNALHHACYNPHTTLAIFNACLSKSSESLLLSATDNSKHTLCAVAMRQKRSQEIQLALFEPYLFERYPIEVDRQQLDDLKKRYIDELPQELHKSKENLPHPDELEQLVSRAKLALEGTGDKVLPEIQEKKRKTDAQKVAINQQGPPAQQPANDSLKQISKTKQGENEIFVVVELVASGGAKAIPISLPRGSSIGNLTTELSKMYDILQEWLFLYGNNQILPNEYIVGNGDTFELLREATVVDRRDTVALEKLLSEGMRIASLDGDRYYATLSDYATNENDDSSEDLVLAGPILTHKLPLPTRPPDVHKLVAVRVCSAIGRKSYNLEVSLNWRVEAMKQKISELTGIPRAKQSLRLSGDVIVDENFLWEAGIQDKSVVYLTLRLCGGATRSQQFEYCAPVAQQFEDYDIAKVNPIRQEPTSEKFGTVAVYPGEWAVNEYCCDKCSHSSCLPRVTLKLTPVYDPVPEGSNLPRLRVTASLNFGVIDKLVMSESQVGFFVDKVTLELKPLDMVCTSPNFKDTVGDGHSGWRTDSSSLSAAAAEWVTDRCKWNTSHPQVDYNHENPEFFRQSGGIPSVSTKVRLKDVEASWEPPKGHFDKISDGNPLKMKVTITLGMREVKRRRPLVNLFFSPTTTKHMHNISGDIELIRVRATQEPRNEERATIPNDTHGEYPCQELGKSLPEVKELEDLMVSCATSTFDGTGDKVFREMQKIEERLVLWLVCLAKCEVLRSYKPTEDDRTWIRRIAKFYHALVPLMRIILEAKLGERREPVSVFVSHTGNEKEAYAAPLTNYLEENGVAGVFLDKDLSIGSKGDDEMMWAAVSCRYFWCVLSKAFVQNVYPMRELLVGYIRHIQESGGGRFSLLLDCVEMGAQPKGAWMEQIFQVEALKLYEANGNSHDFPAGMQPSKTLESFDERYTRIAATPMADGHVLVPDSHVCRDRKRKFVSHDSRLC
jgi:hypothetical protein